VRPYSHSRYWSGIGSQLRLMQGVFSNANSNDIPPLEPSLKLSNLISIENRQNYFHLDPVR